MRHRGAVVNFATAGGWLRRHVASGVAAVAAAGVVGGLIVTGLDSAGAASTQVDLAPGTAWFASPSTGRVSMIDGPTATRVVVRDVGVGGHDLEMVQAGDDGFAIDRTDGTMRRIDSSTFGVGPPVTIGVGEDDRLQVVANRRALWAITQDGTVVQQFDPSTGMPIGGPLGFPGTVKSAALTPDGTLWAIDATTGLVRSYSDDVTRTDTTLAMSAGATIVAAGDIPVLVDQVANSLHTLDPETARITQTSCLDLPPDADALVAGSASGVHAWVVGVLPRVGNVTIADIDADVCRPIPLGPSDDTPRYGAPVAHGSRVFIPDMTAGTVVVIEPGADADPIVARIDLGLTGHRFRLFEHHSFVWFDDPQSDTAGVIRDDLTALLVNKTQGDGLPTPPPDAPAENEEDLPTASCTATPNPAQPGQPVQLDARLSPIGTEVQSWDWSLPQATPPTAVGPQTLATWTSPGQRTVTVTALVTRTESSTAVIEGICTVEIDDQPAAPTTSTSVPDEVAPSTLPPVEPDSPDTTTTIAATIADPTTTVPPTVLPPVTLPPVVPPVPVTPVPVPPVAVPPVVPPPGATTTVPAQPTTTATTTPTTTAPPAAPVTDFDWTPPAPKVGEVVTFNDLTTGTHDQLAWTFEGGSTTTSTAASPTVSWSAPGTFTITLTTSNNGVGSSQQKTITVSTNQVVVPTVSTLDEASARAQLEAAGFVVGPNAVVNRLNPTGTVLATNPPGGTSLDPSTAPPITLTVSSGLGELSTSSGSGVPGFSGDGGLASAASLDAPTQVLVDPNGNIYVADNYNNRVRRIDQATGIITTIAGTTAGFSGDGGPATAAQFRRPRAMAMDATGNLYVADLDNRRVRRITPGGTVTTVAGNGGGSTCSPALLAAAGCRATDFDLGLPSGLAIDPVSGDLLISTRTGCSVYRLRIGSSGHTIGLPDAILLAAGAGTCGASTDGAAPASTTFADAVGIAFDANGILYLTEGNAHRIRRLDFNGVVSTLAGTGTGGFNGDGQAATATQLASPDSIAIRGSLIVFTDWGNNRVRQILPDGTIRTIAGTGTPGYSGDTGAANSGQISLSEGGESAGVAIAPDGTIYIAEAGNHLVRHIR